MTIKLQSSCRVYKFVLIVDLVMQMISCTGTSRTYITYKIAFLNGFTFTDRYPVHMRIGRLITVPVIEFDKIAIPSITSRECNLSVSSSIDRRIARSSQVDTLVAVTLMGNRMYTGTEW